MNEQKISTLEQVRLKLQAKQKYLSTLDPSALKTYNKLNKSLYGCESFTSLSQSFLDSLREQSRRYANGFDQLILDSLESNIQFSSLQ